MNPPSKLAARMPRGWFVLALLLLAVGAGYWFWLRHDEASNRPEYRTANITRGSLTASVSATGTLNPVTSVQVGSQVSGQIRELLADYNSPVRQGQLIARIDPQTFEARVNQAQADLETAQAQVLTNQASISAARAALSRAEVNHAEAKRDLDRKRQLLERAFISPAELDKAQSVFNASSEDVKAARAQLQVTQAQAGSAQAIVRQREAQLAQARIDLERTAIRAPVDGVVIKRSVDTGQTVAATLQSPELFVIARDLRDMQVDASVDEAEIGKIREGQTATFTVDSFPGRQFSGEVTQVRKSALTVQNVVTYVVVVSARNPDLALVPGMTANVRIVTETRKDVLKVPNAALRFRPPGHREQTAAQGGLAMRNQLARGPQGSNETPEPQALEVPKGAARLLERLTSLLLPAAQAQSGSPLAQMRERLVRELDLSQTQQQQLDAILAGMRDKFIAARNAPPPERTKLSERNRAELRERIQEILDPAQRERYAALIAQTAGRQATRGRIFVLDEQGQPRAVQVRVGISDGSFTEVSADDLREGDMVLIGIAGGASATSSASLYSGPRLPF
ncbi:MAG: efflux RND transporter periplasmic adaptor subunit [Quisquiliibacterium sp.]